MSTGERAVGPSEPGAERSSVGHDDLAREAALVVAVAERRDLPLRVVGGVGIRQRLQEARERYDRLRPVPHDIDMLAPGGTGDLVKEVFLSLGYRPDDRLIAWHGKSRHRYFHLDGASRQPDFDVDVFLGLPPLCHRIGDLGDRLRLPGPAATPTDLLLLKLQIHSFTEKDLVDIVFLLAEHELAEHPDKEAIDLRRILEYLRRDWGFYYTATENLKRVRASETGLPPEVGGTVSDRIRQLLEAIDAEPKTVRFKMRARIGTRLQWYEPVEEIER